MTDDTSHPSLIYPIPAVAAVVIRENKVLLVCRGQQPNKGYWGFPGGKIEVGETIKEAAIRELNEETSITAQAEHILTAFDVIIRDETHQTCYHYILIPVLCTHLEGTAKAASDAAEVRWFHLDELNENTPNLIASVLDVIKETQRLPTIPIN